MTEQRRALAQTKVSRQQQIVTILTRQEVGSQSQLAQLLAAEGIDVTQATLSRDLVDRKSTRLNSSHVASSYAVFCLKKKLAFSQESSCISFANMILGYTTIVLTLTI